MSTATAARLYDLLDVAPEATPEEIRTAWRTAIDGLEPADRRFRAYNSAAEVLLDADRRAAYDAELADELEGSEDAVEVPTARGVTRARPSARPRRRNHPAWLVPRSAGGQSQPSTAGPHRRTDSSDPASSAGRRPVRGWVLVVLALLTAAAVSLASWLWFQVPSDASIAASTRQAQAAAERAIVPVLSYDASTLDADQAAGAAYLTADYREDYDQLYEVIRQNAPRVGTKVSAEVVASGVVRSGADRVEVLVFVNRPTTNKRQDEPVVYRDQVTMTMVDVGGSWLVDGLKTSPAGQ